MDFRDYQIMTRLTDKGVGSEHGLDPVWVFYVLGIAGETGELVEKIKKHFRDDYGVMTEEKLKQIKKEMGDCFWYHARLADVFGINLNDVVEGNLEKQLDRMERNVLHGSGDDR